MRTNMPRFMSDVDRALAKVGLNPTAVKPPTGPTPPPTSPPSGPPTGPGKAAADDGYPSEWLPSAESTSRINFAERPTAESESKPGAGVDYPAGWDTSPVDANDETGTRAGRVAAAPVEKRPSGAGVDYPADWAR